MRQQTLQEQYNLIVEGKGNPSAFHKQVLKQFPNLFTAQSSFDQVVTVLKQKSIISEMVAQGLVSNSSEPNFFEIFNTNMAKLNEEAKAEEKKADEHAVDAKKKTAKDKSDKNIDNQNGAEFLLGFYVESRNAKNVDKTVEEIRDIVVKNLSKDPLHYVKSGQFGVEGLGYKEDVPGLGQTKEVKGKYASSGMEPVKLSESFQSLEKKLEKKGKSHEAAAKIAGKVANLKRMGHGKGPTAKQKKRFDLEEAVDVYTINAAALLQSLESNTNFINSVKKEINNDLAKKNIVIKKLEDYAKSNASDSDIKAKVEMAKKELNNASPMREAKDNLVNEILKRLTGK